MAEPQEGVFNETYIQSVVDFVARLNSHGVYVILDMHQDCWSPYYCDAHGVPSQYAHGYNTSDYQPGGSRAYPEPVVVPTYDKHGHITNCDEVGKHLFGWSTCYVTYSIGAAAQRLYDNDQGILDKFGRFWQMIASKVRDYPNLLGYELINEPWLGDVPLSLGELNPEKNPHWDLWFPKVSDSKNLAGTYKTLHQYIRQVDNDSIIFFEPATGGNFLDAWPVGFEEGPGGVEYDDRQALSYHVYCPFLDTKNSSGDIFQWLVDLLSLDACDVMNEAMYDVRRDDAESLKLAGFLTEFGNSGTGVSEDFINFAAGKMDEFFHGWTFWYLTPDPKSPNTSEIRALARPYPHTVAGVPTIISFDPDSLEFELSYVPCQKDPCASKPTEIYTSLEYQYASGFSYSVESENTVSTTLNKTSSMLYVQVTKLVPNASVSVYFHRS